jgi:glycosyltransferase involved in cell wall biosynthesis
MKPMSAKTRTGPSQVVPHVSVVMSVYNGGPYLAEAIESVLRQSFQNFEFLLINDGSTDGSGELLDEYARSDERVRVIHQENRGLIASLNRGCSEARGDLIARMDADDVCLPHRFEQQVRFLEEHHGVGIVGGITRYIDANGVLSGRGWPSWSSPAVNGWRLMFETVLCHPTVMMRREVYTQLGGYDSTALHAEDYELWTRALFQMRIANLQDVVLTRRMWDGMVGVQHAGRQEQTVVGAMRRLHSKLLGEEVDLESAAALRALHMLYRRPGDQRAVEVPQPMNAASLLRRLLDAYTHRFPLSSTDREVIRQDVAARLLVLARQPLTRRAERVRLGLQAAWLSPEKSFRSLCRAAASRWKRRSAWFHASS